MTNISSLSDCTLGNTTATDVWENAQNDETIFKMTHDGVILRKSGLILLYDASGRRTFNANIARPRQILIRKTGIYFLRIKRSNYKEIYKFVFIRTY